jgi:hypothetical protein
MGFKVNFTTKRGKLLWFLFHFFFLPLLLSLKLHHNFMNPLQLPLKTTRIFTYWVRQQMSKAFESHSEDTAAQITA